jgi:2-polyprenyl-6-methoxyphenol hydroxylase-like FAD-dependent oxidoreductase
LVNSAFDHAGMAEILVLGAGLNGLSTAAVLALDGHEVTVLERDPADPSGSPDALWDSWNRPGVNQFHLPHLMLPRWRELIERELPDVLDELVSLGGLRFNLLAALPGELAGHHRDGDERYDTVTARRPVVEAAVVAVATRMPGVTIRRGLAVTGLTTGREVLPGVPHVTGVLTDEGTAIRAELVVDATGRRSPVGSMLEATGGVRPVELREDSGFVYYGRHFRSADGALPPCVATVLEHFDSISILTLPCDNGTWATVFTTSAGDKALRRLRDISVWDAALALYPTAAHWGTGEPITDVQVMSAIEDRHRRFVVDGEPVVTGLVAVGDAWACTNPSLGRGTSIGLVHCCALRDLLRQVGPDEPEKLARRFDEVTESVVGDLYRMTLGFDRHRLAEIEGDISGQPYVTSDPAWAITKAIDAAKFSDPDALRARLSIGSLQATPPEALAQPGLLDKIIALGANAPQYPTPGPTRTELLATIANRR